MSNFILVKTAAAGLAAGFVTGLFGGGGGMILVPLLTFLVDLQEESVFPTSVAVILPTCIVSVLLTIQSISFDWLQVVPYLLGSLIGGIAAGVFGRNIPVQWLHRVLGVLVIWGGYRFLC